MFLRLARNLLPALSICLACAQDADLSRLYGHAKTAEASGDYKTATADYQRIIRLRPDMAEAYAKAGNLYYMQGESQKAETCFRKAVALKPSLPGPHFLLGVLDFKARKYRDALGSLSEAERLDGTNGLVQSYLGYTQFALRNYREAVIHLENAAASNPNDIDVFYHLAKAYADLASEDFGELKKSFPDSLQTTLARAHLYEAQQNWEQALEMYQKMAAIKPDYPNIQAKLQQIAARKAGQIGLPERAAVSPEIDPKLDGALALFYQPPTGKKVFDLLHAYLSREHELRTHPIATAETLYQLAEDDQALSYLAGQWVFEIDPESYRAHEIKAQYYEESNNDEKAVAEYRKAMEINPQLPNMHFVIGNLYWKRDRLDEALVELQKELESNPSHPQALYEAGDVLLARERLAEAEACFLKALKTEPDMKEANLALARIYTDQHQDDKAAVQLRRAANIDPQDPTPHYRLSKLYQDAGKTQEAKNELATFAKLKQQQSADRGH